MSCSRFLPTHWAAAFPCLSKTITLAVHPSAQMRKQLNIFERLTLLFPRWLINQPVQGSAPVPSFNFGWEMSDNVVPLRTFGYQSSDDDFQMLTINRPPLKIARLRSKTPRREGAQRTALNILSASRGDVGCSPICRLLQRYLRIPRTMSAKPIQHKHSNVFSSLCFHSNTTHMPAFMLM